jgi:hypothetical protein
MVGNASVQSKILLKDEPDPDGFKIIHPPVDFRESFELALEDSIRDIGGQQVHGSSKFIHDREGVVACVDTTRSHPFTTESIVLDFKKDVAIEDYLLHSKLFDVKLSKRRPRVDPDALRYIHCDLALSGDCAGIAMGHAGPPIEVPRHNTDGSAYKVMAPSIYIDLMLQIKPPQGSQIDLSKIRQFIGMLAAYGTQIKKVTFDGFASADAIQILMKMGFEAGLVSCDRDDKAYTYLRQAMYEHRISYYEYKAFLREVLALERDPKTRKIDHPRVNGSKDVSDAVAGVCLNIMTAEELMFSKPRATKRIAVPAMNGAHPDDTGWLLGKDEGRIMGIR